MNDKVEFLQNIYKPSNITTDEITTRDFTWDGNKGSTFISDLEAAGHKIGQTFTMVGSKTGKKIVFEIMGTIETEEGEVRGWLYAPTAQYHLANPLLVIGMKVTIFND